MINIFPTSNSILISRCTAIFICYALLFLPGPSRADDASIDQLISIENEFESLSSNIFKAFKTDEKWNGNKGYTDCQQFIKNDQWGKCIKSLDHINTASDHYRADLSNILYGISYHNSDNSQLAFNHYKLIPSDSIYYIHAQLYIALLHTRYNRPQKASRLISRLIQSSADRITAEMMNKLRLIQGHVYFLSKNFSASRKALKDISINSQYINDATVALALGHIYQSDYESAEKYLSYLAVKSIKDIPADTANILLAFAHSQESPFSQPTISAYKTAIQYYKKRINEIDLLLAGRIGLPIINSKTSGRIFIIENNMLDLSKSLPESFLANYVSLSGLSQTAVITVKDNKLYKDTTRIHNHYEQTVLAEARRRLITRKTMLSRYLNQCMYTLARLLYQHKLQ